MWNPCKSKREGIISHCKNTENRKRETEFTLLKSCKSKNSDQFDGSFENEALENEDRSTKHPNLENEAPKTRKRSTLDRKRSTQKLDTGLSFINTRPMLIQQESSTITNSPVPHHRAWSQAVILEQILPGSDLIWSRSVIDIQYVRLTLFNIVNRKRETGLTL